MTPREMAKWLIAIPISTFCKSNPIPFHIVTSRKDIFLTGYPLPLCEQGNMSLLFYNLKNNDSMKAIKVGLLL